MTKLTVEQQLKAAAQNLNPAVEPEGLPQFTPGKHAYLGDLSLGLCHMFLAVQDMKGEDDTVKACAIFSNAVAALFKLEKGTEFAICKGFKVVQLETLAESRVVEHDDMASY